jgi:hypothetical protein
VSVWCSCIGGALAYHIPYALASHLLRRYPEAQPTFSLGDTRGLSAAHLDELLAGMRATAAAEAGAPVVYALVEGIKAFLNGDLGEPEPIVYTWVAARGLGGCCFLALLGDFFGLAPFFFMRFICLGNWHASFCF